jgi:hypothetical protein
MMRRRGPGLMRTVARTAVVAGTASAVAGNVHHRQQQKWEGQQAEQQAQADAQYAEVQEQDQVAQMQQQLNQLQAQQTAAAAGPPADGGGGDLVAELSKLGELKAAGILSEEEFQAAKARLLG